MLKKPILKIFSTLNLSHKSSQSLKICLLAMLPLIVIVILISNNLPFLIQYFFSKINRLSTSTLDSPTISLTKLHKWSYHLKLASLMTLIIAQLVLLKGKIVQKKSLLKVFTKWSIPANINQHSKMWKNIRKFLICLRNAEVSFDLQSILSQELQSLVDLQNLSINKMWDQVF